MTITVSRSPASPPPPPPPPPDRIRLEMDLEDAKLLYGIMAHIHRAQDELGNSPTYALTNRLGDALSQAGVPYTGNPFERPLVRVRAGR